MSITTLPFVQGFIKTCQDGWDQGWHERNGGNLTYRLTKKEAWEAAAFFAPTPGPLINLEVPVPTLGDEMFLATGSGRFFRNVAGAPQDNLCLVQVNKKGTAYQKMWGLPHGGNPTSELPSHLMNHSVRKSVTQGDCRIIYHAHPTNIIAMTFILPLTAKAFTRALWQSATECPVVFPLGVGVVPWMVPGGGDIAKATSKLMESYDAVVWAHHGLFVSGVDFDTTFGLMHTIEKAAEIYMCIRKSGQPILQTISDENLRAIAKSFGVKLEEAFLTD